MDSDLLPAGRVGQNEQRCTISSTTTAARPWGRSPRAAAGGYVKPSWQAGPGVPSDGKRDLPDVSLFAGDSTIQNFYVVCESGFSRLSTPTRHYCKLRQSCLSPFSQISSERAVPPCPLRLLLVLVALIDQKSGSSTRKHQPRSYICWQLNKQLRTATRVLHQQIHAFFTT